MFRLVSILARTVLTALGAAAMLLALSYPHALVPPDPAMDYPHKLALYDFREYLWVLPWLFMEMASLAGPRRNLVWFSGLGLTLTAAIIIWPIAESTAPELVHPTFSYEDGKLARGLGWMLVLLLLGILMRCVILRFLFPPPAERNESPDRGQLEAAVLDPDKARTVAEIAADPVKVDPKFLFGDADESVLAHLRAILQKLRRLRALKYGAIALFFACLAAWFFFYPRPTEQQALERDLEVMYQYKTVNGEKRATYPAVHAAYRVMRHISDHETFAGYSREEAEKWLRLDRVPESYRRQIRDESDMQLPFISDDFESRTRFLTISTGHAAAKNGGMASGRTAVLYIRTNAAGDTINISEVLANGWNKRADLYRWAVSSDLNVQFLRN